MSHPTPQLLETPTTGKTFFSFLATDPCGLLANQYLNRKPVRCVHSVTFPAPQAMFQTNGLGSTRRPSVPQRSPLMVHKKFGWFGSGGKAGLMAPFRSFPSSVARSLLPVDVTDLFDWSWPACHSASAPLVPSRAGTTWGWESINRSCQGFQMETSHRMWAWQLAHWIRAICMLIFTRLNSLAVQERGASSTCLEQCLTDLAALTSKLW